MTSDKDIFIEYKESNVLLEQYRIKRLEEGKRKNYSELENENVLNFIKNNGTSQINSIFKLMNIKKLEDIKW